MFKIEHFLVIFAIDCGNSYHMLLLPHTAKQKVRRMIHGGNSTLNMEIKVQEVEDSIKYSYHYFSKLVSDVVTRCYHKKSKQ